MRRTRAMALYLLYPRRKDRPACLFVVEPYTLSGVRSRRSSPTTDSRWRVYRDSEQPTSAPSHPHRSVASDTLAAETSLICLLLRSIGWHKTFLSESNLMSSPVDLQHALERELEVDSHEILRLEEQVLMLLHARAAKTELRNSYSSIHRLPEDIIQRVFLFVRPDHLDSVRGHHEYFVILTHVCAPWRRMAMASPLLWTRVPCADPAHTVWVLEHVAGLTALDIRLDITESFTRVADWSRPKRTPIIRGLFDHAARMRRVVISTSSGSLEEDAFDILRNFVSSPARTLEVFALEHDMGEPHARWFTPEALFNHEAPMLTELRLRHTVIQPEWRVLQHLSILKIVEPAHWKLLISPLLDLFFSMKLLSSLLLSNALSADIPGLSVLEPKVAALAGLEYLLVDDELTRLVPFLASLRLRPGSLKQLRIKSDNNDHLGSALVDTLLRLPLCIDFARSTSRDARFCKLNERYDGMLLRFMLREADVPRYSRYYIQVVPDSSPMLDLDVSWCDNSTRDREPYGQWLPNTPMRYSIM
jgi:hypothetical protein